VTLSAFQGFEVGAAVFLSLGVLLGRWSLLLLWRASWRAQYLRELARTLPRPVPAVHAGQYVDPARVRAGVCGQYVDGEPEYPSFRQVR